MNIKLNFTALLFFTLNAFSQEIYTPYKIVSNSYKTIQGSEKSVIIHGTKKLRITNDPRPKHEIKDVPVTRWFVPKLSATSVI